MKIMILVPSFGKASPVYGAFLFAKYLKENDINVVFSALDSKYNTNESIVDEIEEASIDFKCLDIVGWTGIFFHKRKLREFVKETNADVIVSYLLRPHLLIANMSGLLRIAYIRGMLRQNYSILYGKAISRIAMYWQLNALKRMHLLFVLTKSMSNWLISEGIRPEKIFMANNFVDVLGIRERGIAWNHHNGREINIGIFCDLNSNKRVDLALKALSKLVSVYNHVEIKLHIVGDGNLRNRLETLSRRIELQSKVTFYGFVKNPLPIMKDMDLVLLTSESEGLPRCIMEALSLGKTVVVSDLPGITELVRNRQTGYLFPAGDSDELAALIDNIIRNKLYLPSDKLVQFMLDNYDVTKCCEKMLNKINELMLDRVSLSQDLLTCERT